MPIIYFLIAFLATTVGSMTGLGGGVIIKPILDTIGQYDIQTISILSSITVFSMAVVSITRQIKLGFKIEKCFCLVALGAIIGGVAGKYFFNKLVQNIDINLLGAIQSIILAIILVLVLYKDIIRVKDSKDSLRMIVLGVTLGAISTFLGIGGGPINVAALTIFIGLSVKDSAVVSILIILLAQFSNLILTKFTIGFNQFDLTMLFFMIPAAIIGGIIGCNLNRRFDSKQIQYTLNILLVGIILLTTYNGIVSLILYL